jgi:hypothetical protein
MPLLVMPEPLSLPGQAATTASACLGESWAKRPEIKQQQ